MNKYAVVTGASTGLGKAFAFELANRKINVILIALPNEGLPQLVEQLKQLGVDAVCYETDLTRKENVQQITDQINQHYSVFMLINNAGLGGTKRFIEADLSYLDAMIQLNVVSLTLMTRALLPNLLKQQEGYVLNVSSMAAFSPMGFKTVYPASKAFVYHFARGLYQELKDTSVFVSVVSPGPMRTNLEVTERIKRQSLFARAGVLSPEKVATISINKLLKRDALILLNLGNSFHWLLMKMLPVWVRLPLLTNGVKRELKKEEYSRSAAKAHVNTGNPV
jgi:uncharacterized protein